VIDRIIWRSSCAMDTVPSWFTYLDELTGRLGSLGANKALSALISESICMPNNPKYVGAWAFQRLGSIHYGSEDLRGLNGPGAWAFQCLGSIHYGSEDCRASMGLGWPQ